MSCIVYKFTNCDNFYTEKNLLPNISLVMKTFNDYDENDDKDNEKKVKKNNLKNC